MASTKRTVIRACQVSPLDGPLSKTGRRRRSRLGVPVFDGHADDSYDESTPSGGVRVTDTHTKIKITEEARDGPTIDPEVCPVVK